METATTRLTSSFVDARTNKQTTALGLKIPGGNVRIAVRIIPSNIFLTCLTSSKRARGECEEWQLIYQRDIWVSSEDFRSVCWNPLLEGVCEIVPDKLPTWYGLLGGWMVVFKGERAFYTLYIKFFPAVQIGSMKRNSEA